MLSLLTIGVRDVADLMKEIEEVEKWGGAARLVRVRDMKKFAKSAKATADDLRNRLYVRTSYDPFFLSG